MGTQNLVSHVTMFTFISWKKIKTYLYNVFEENKILINRKVSYDSSHTWSSNDEVLYLYSGYIGPGGLHDGGKHYNCTGGAAQYIDVLVLGKNHIYGNPTPKVNT